MQKSQSMVAGDLGARLDDLFREFGMWTISRALLLAMMRHSVPANRLEDLDAHMRRDIGVPDAPDIDADRFKQVRRYW